MANPDYAMLIEFNLSDGSDTWLREKIQRDEPTHQPVRQRVIVQNSEEAYRLVHAMAALKSQRRKPYGGAWSRRVEPV